MTCPAIVLATSDQLLEAELTSQLSGTAEFHLAPALVDVAPIVQEHSAWGAVLDFRGIRAGGHAEERSLEALLGRFPDLRLFALLGVDCPEPLERFCACHPASVFRGSAAREELIAQLRQELPADPPAAQAAQEQTVLTGLTRQFETRTPRVKLMLQELEIAARHDVTVLLIGETGSGKTFLSRLIHEVSQRRNEPFVHVACGALPGDLIESELFGHVRGAFTSAHADKDGKFVAAARGTILLDEIDVLGPDQQVKLLRVIESGEFEPIGSNRTLRSQARLIVASNLDLQPLVQAGRFRPDLYYRLNMLKFEIPPLRARKPDVVPLCEKFVAQHARKHGVVIESISPGFLQALLAYPWPGNVRELENVIQRAVIYCRDGVLVAEHLPTYILMGIAGPTNDASVILNEVHTVQAAASHAPSASAAASLGRQIALTERDIIEQALAQNNFSRTNTARALGISRVTLYNKMKKYGMK